jgi:hypothetical protein
MNFDEALAHEHERRTSQRGWEAERGAYEATLPARMAAFEEACREAATYLQKAGVPDRVTVMESSGKCAQVVSGWRMKEGVLLFADGSITKCTSGVIEKPRYDTALRYKERTKAGRRIGLDWGDPYYVVEFVSRGKVAPYPFPVKGGHPDPMLDKSTSDSSNDFDGKDWLAQSVYDLVNGN